MMTKKDFFSLIIKLFGLYAIITALFTSLPQSISFAFTGLMVYPILFTLLVLVALIGVFVLLIFKSELLVRWLKLEKGFDDDKLELGNLTTREIVKIAVIIIGGFLIIDNIPVFINQTFHAFFSDIQSKNVNTNVQRHWFVSGMKVVIGYLMITNLGFISRILKIK